MMNSKLEVCFSFGLARNGKSCNDYLRTTFKKKKKKKNTYRLKFGEIHDVLTLYEVKLLFIYAKIAMT